MRWKAAALSGGALSRKTRGTHRMAMMTGRQNGRAMRSNARITNAVVQSGAFFASGTSFDWNASIAATTVGNVFVTWTSDFASATAPGTPVQVRFSGRLAGDPAGVIGAGFLLSTSPLACYNPSTDNVERWGDYSAVSIDPLSSLRAWGVNEKILSGTIWSTRIGNMGY